MSAETESPAAAPAVPCKQLEDGVNHLMQGKRHLLVKDYPSAVTSLADACALIAGKYGDLAPECGEPYLCYGKALLELARAEAGVIEMNPPKSDSDEEQEDDGDDEDDKDSKEDREEAESKEDSDEASKSSEEDTAKEEDLAKKDDAGKEDDAGKKDDAEKKDDDAEMKDDTEKKEDGVKNGGDGVKNGDAEKKEDEEKEDAEKEEPAENGEAKTENGTSNGAGPSKSTEDGEELDDDKEEDGDVNNLQLAWEILEMAKIIYQKQVDAGTNIKDCKIKLTEVLLKLGEVGIESENWPTAIDDLKACLAMQKEVLEKDDRRLAETYYHLAVAHSNNNQYQESIESYEKACNQLQVRIDALEAKRPNEDIINQGLIDSEIKELKDLLVEMKERLNDTVTEKDEPAPKEDQDDVVKNGSESKPVSSIAHLVRKKPKAEPVESKSEVKSDNVEKTAESNVEEKKRKSEEADVAPVTQKKAKLETET